MDDDLQRLWAKAVNAPTQPRPPGARNHEVVRAVVAGVGPVLKEQFDALRAENETLKAENERLRTEVRTEIAVVKAAIGSLRAEFHAEIEAVNPARYAGPATSRLLS